MKRRYFLAAMLLCLPAACASMEALNPGATSYKDVGSSLQQVVTTYRTLAPRLTSEQREEFKKAYGDVCASYEVAGKMLVAAIEGEDSANANTAMMNYQRIVIELPDRVSAVSRLLQTFGKKQTAD